ncbi:SCO1860 family LAETG-anchored protein [Streptomyces sp. NBC_01497]|uniref:SCO1860 family LAETG-anchored protein n=1 Tax=Streptomyces sp. NBC_01497 TaxID=2903885 RepID=UPI002E37961B|nr:SCO1860 family LAETG-anchored protein [Streptomyces sp. NBC_01497]
MPARRYAAIAAAAALTAGPVLLAAPASATGVEGGGGAAHAAVLKAGLDVSLLNRSVDVPLNTSLNEVEAPRSADKKALSLTVDGVDKGKPFSMLSADVADARATVAGGKAEGYVNVAHAKVHVPGLPLLSLIEIQQVTSRATCEAGKHPVAASNLLGDVTVLGKRITLSTAGPTKVSVPGVGDVSLELSQTRTTSRTAAATALSLDVSVNPLKLNVADVQGSVKLATADCTTPRRSGSHGGGAPSKPTDPRTGAPSQAPAPASSAPDVTAQSASDPKPVPTAKENLAETGGSSTTPYIAGGAAVLLVAGAGAVVLAKRRTSQR